MVDVCVAQGLIVKLIGGEFDVRLFVDIEVAKLYIIRCSSVLCMNMLPVQCFVESVYSFQIVLLDFKMRSRTVKWHTHFIPMKNILLWFRVAPCRLLRMPFWLS